MSNDDGITVIDSDSIDLELVDDSIIPVKTVDSKDRRPCPFCFGKPLGCVRCHFTGLTILWVDPPTPDNAARAYEMLNRDHTPDSSD